jgi:SAM-dependent methyltransferase
VGFDVPGAAYDAYMGRYSRRLAAPFADFAGLPQGARVVDVGCGPGALTGELAERLGAERVAAADPSQRFAQACRERFPGADVRVAGAERLPWPDAVFDAALAQLVVAFMADAEAGAAEMRRVVRPGGTVAACSWDLRGGMRMLATFWEAARAVDAGAPDEAGLRWCTPQELSELFAGAGLDELELGELEIEAGYADFDDYWGPFLAGVGPAGAYCAGLDGARQERIRDECRRLLGDPPGPFRLSARAWAVRGRVPRP